MSFYRNVTPNPDIIMQMSAAVITDEDLYEQILKFAIIILKLNIFIVKLDSKGILGGKTAYIIVAI